MTFFEVINYLFIIFSSRDELSSIDFSADQLYALFFFCGIEKFLKSLNGLW